MSSKGWQFVAAFVSIFGCLGLAQGIAAAAPGELDGSFGQVGVLDLRSKLTGSPVDIAGVSGRKTLVLSQDIRCERPSESGCAGSLFLTRFGADGSRDRSFGGGDGELTVPIGLKGLSGGQLALDSKGRLLVATVYGGRTVEVVRLNPGGSLDASFGAGGRAVASGPHEVYEMKMVVGEDDKIVFAGRRLDLDRAYPNYPFTSAVALVRFRPDGTLDPTLGGTGSASVTLAESNMEGTFSVQPGGAVIMAWYQCCSASPGLRVARVRADGSLDPSFGPRGGSLSDTTEMSELLDVATVVTRPHGNVDIVGTSAGAGFLLRLRRNGSPQQSFGRRGMRLFEAPFSDATVDRDGRIFAVGWDWEREGLIVTRLRADGRLDRSYSGGYGELVRTEENGPVTIAAQPGGAAVLLDKGIPFCPREACPPPSPRLIRFRGGPRGARCLGHKASIVGTRRGETLKGTPHRDVIAGLGGNDTIRAGGGNDLVCGGRGRDRLIGGSGHDRLAGGPGRDHRHQ